MNLFFIMSDGQVIKKIVDGDRPLYGQNGMSLAARAEQIIAVTQFGMGKTIKNRHNEKPKYFTKDEMVMLALQAETHK